MVIKRSLGGLGVAGVDGGHPDGPFVVVDAVPDATATGYLVLPLGQLDAVYGVRGKATLQGLLAPTPSSGIGGNEFPGRSDVVGGGCAELFPGLGGVVAGESAVPPAIARWRGDSVPATGHQSAAGGGRTRPPWVMVMGVVRRAVSSGSLSISAVFSQESMVRSTCLKF